MHKISVIGGCGNMSKAIINGMMTKGLVKPNQVIVSDVNKQDYPSFKLKGISTVDSNLTAVAESNIIILAVKPQIVPDIINELKDVNLKNHLILSIVAGVPIEYYKDNLDITNFVRVMPNMPSMINQGMSAWYPYNCSNEDLSITREILSSIGNELQLEQESDIDIATAISGSGPSYLFLLAESMIDSGVHLGLTRTKSRYLVLNTLLGSSNYLCDNKYKDKNISEMKNEITSPGGTTAEALYTLEKQSFRTSVNDAIFAAYYKSKKINPMK